MGTSSILSFLALGLVVPLATAGDEDTSGAPLFNGKTKVTANMGKGITFDDGDDFKLNLKGIFQAQYRFGAIDNGVPDTSSFLVRRARLKFSGHAFSPETRYNVQIETVSSGTNSSLLDGWIQQKLWSNDEMNLDVRAGQQKTLYGREATGSSTGLEFTERSVVARSFSDSRSRGANLLLTGAQGRLHVHGGAFNTSTAHNSPFASEEGDNTDNELDYGVGATFDSADGMSGLGYKQGDLARREELAWSGGANFWFGAERQGGNDIDTIGYNFNGAVKYKGFHGLAEFFGYSAEPDTPASVSVDSTGFSLQGSYHFEEGYSVGARFALITLDDDPGNIGITAVGGAGGGTLSAAGDLTEISIGAGKYWNGHARKIVADVTIQSVEPDVGIDSDNIILRIMYSIIL